MAGPLTIAAAAPQQQQTPPPPAPRGVQWVDVATAAQRMGVDERTVRRRCGEQWFGQGLARQERGPDGRLKPQWFVREDADPLLARVLFPEQMASDLKRLPDAKRRAVLWKKAVLDA